MNIFKWQKELYFLPVIEKKKKKFGIHYITRLKSSNDMSVTLCNSCKTKRPLCSIICIRKMVILPIMDIMIKLQSVKTIRASAAPGAVGLCPGSFAACLVVHYSPSNNVLHASSKNIIVRSFPMRPTLPLVGKKVSVCPKKRRISDYRGRISKSESLFLFVYWKYIYQC